VSAILALDQGTTSSRAIVFDETATPCAGAAREIAQSYPAPGYVEHDPEEIFTSTVAAGREALAAAKTSASDIAAIGITNQRETTVVWDRATGRPIHPAVVWQSRASAEICERMKREGLEALVRDRTGLVIDAYFSGTKIRWILDQVEGAQARAERGELACGTVDTWLMWKLTGGRVHATDVSNASRTLVFDIHRCAWDDDLLHALAIPRPLLPTVVPSSGVMGEADPVHFGRAVPIAGIVGDQQAALFGQTCFMPGEAKNTYGTGCFLLANTGERAPAPTGGLLATIAWDLGDGVRYALEGSAFVTGAAVQWLRDGLGIIASADETEALAMSVPGGSSLFVVPAFTGLGAPHWDMYARGLIIGIERSTTRAHIVRATLESIAYQTRDLVEAMAAAGHPTRVLRVDGGGTANAFLMQLQADVLGVPVEVAAVRETTALGAASLAGLATGVWGSVEDLRARHRVAARFEPRMTSDERESRYRGWLRAVERARGWAAASP
jgi:glycerol kinase